MDVVGASLLILLGAALANLLDTAFELTPKITSWIGRFLD